MITPAQRAEIRRLYYGEHWKLGTIAAQLGLHRETVRAAVERGAGSVRRGACRPSALDPYLPFIRDTLTQYPTLRATRIHEMVRQRGYPGSVIQVRRLVRRLRPESTRTVYRRVVTLIAEHYVDPRVMLSLGQKAGQEWSLGGSWMPRTLHKSYRDSSHSRTSLESRRDFGPTRIGVPTRSKASRFIARSLWT